MQQRLEGSASEQGVRALADDTKESEAQLLHHLRELRLQKEELRKQLEAMGEGQGELAALRRDNDTLRTQLAKSDAEPSSAPLGAAATRERATLRFQVRELEAQIAQLEAERSALKMRAMNAEEQLSELQGAMASNLLRYQKEILRLRHQAYGRSPDVNAVNEQWSNLDGKQ